jgi:hypothetical protein
MRIKKFPGSHTQPVFQPKHIIGGQNKLQGSAAFIKTGNAGMASEPEAVPGERGENIIRFNHNSSLKTGYGQIRSLK